MTDRKLSDSASEKQLQDASKSCTTHKETPVINITPLKAYFQVFLAFCVMCFGNLPFYTIAGLQSSLNGALGLAPSALYHVTWIAGSVLTQTLVAILGLKLTVVLSAVFTSAYGLGFYYPNWPLLFITSAVAGFADGPLISVPNIYANIMACSLAKAKQRDIKYYVGLFQGIVGAAGLLGGAILGNAASSTIFLLDEYLSRSVNNYTHTMWLNGSQNLSTLMDPTMGNTTNETSAMGACMLESTAREVTTGAYYTLLAVSTLSSAISCISALFLINVPERSFTCMPVKAMLSTLTRSLIGTAKMLKVPKYMLVMLLGAYTGLEAAFFLSFFTKYFVTDCIGVGLVGASVMVFSICTSISGVVSGKMMAYTSRTLYSFFSLLLILSLYVFMIVWEKEPSYAAIFILSAGLGVSGGQWTTLATSYLGVIGSKESEKVFGIFWAARGIGGTISFVVAIFISSSTIVVSILLSVLVAGYVLYFIGEAIFGEKLQFFRKLCKRFHSLRTGHGIYDLNNSEPSYERKLQFVHKPGKRFHSLRTEYGIYDLGPVYTKTFLHENDTF